MAGAGRAICAKARDFGVPIYCHSCLVEAGGSRCGTVDHYHAYTPAGVYSLKKPSQS